MDRSKRLASMNVTSQDAVEEAVAQMEVSKRELALAETRKRILELELARAKTVLGQKVIVSPIDGIVMERKLYAGEYLDQDGQLATIAQLDPLSVEAFVADSEYSKFSVGLAVRVTVSEPRDEVLVGTVQVIDRVLDAAS
ncbi:MAG: HlyD family efflux transporter periplasmic adaptor subunit, partial [Mesorhizobium sp.]